MADMLEERNREIFLDWNWESVVEERRSAAIGLRLSRFYYVSDRTIFRAVEAAALAEWKPSPTALTSVEVFSHRIFKVMRETYMGGHEAFRVIVGKCQVSEHRSLPEAKLWIGTKIKLIQARMELVKMMDH